MGKRMLAMLLVLAMLVSVLPTGAAAEGVEPKVETVAETEEVTEEVTEETVEKETEAEVTEETAAETEPEETAEETEPAEVVPEESESVEDGQETFEAGEIVASGTCGENLTWMLDEAGTLRISGSGEMEDYNNYSSNIVPWYSNRDRVKTVVIENGVCSIGNSAFSSCNNLTNVAFSESVARIGRSAFGSCPELTSIVIPEGIVVIENETFRYCENLTSVIIPETVTEIGEYAFEECNSLTSISIPKSITSIGSCAFGGCSSLIAITIPEKMSKIENYTFSGCSSLVSVVLPENLTAIGKYAFRDCVNLTSVTIPKGVVTIEEGTFDGCSGLISLTIPDSVTTIGAWAFSECSGLISLTIPNGVTTIQTCAFERCRGLTSLKIPDSVSTIGQGAFELCDSLKEVIIPKGITEMDNGAFSSCSNLESVIVSEGVTMIGSYAFSACHRLKKVAIPKSVTDISVGAFRYCSSLDNIIIPENVSIIGSYAFDSCNSLTRIVLPESVNSIGINVFSQCSNLTNIKIPDSITEIPQSSFSGCTKLENVTISSSVKTIERRAFYNCPALTDIFYSGTESDWQAIQIDANNDALQTATLHCQKAPGIDLPGHVAYFAAWDPETQTAYFNSAPADKSWNKGCRVTEETDTAFLDQVSDLVGTYVLADIQTNNTGTTGPDTLLSIKSVEKKSGAVQSFSTKDNTIQIDGINYGVNSNLFAVEGETVLYFLCEDRVVNVLSDAVSKTGTVSYWSAEKRVLQIGGSDYRLDELADQAATDILGASGNKELRIDYFEYLGAIFKLQVHEDPPSIYDVSWGDFESSRDPGEKYVYKYQNEWRNAYQNWVQAVQEALNAYVNSPETKKQEAIQEKAKQMRAHDRSSYDRFLSASMSGSFEDYAENAYLALANFFYDEVDNTVAQSLPEMDPSKPLTAAKYVNVVASNMRGKTQAYKLNGLNYQIRYMGYLTAGFGKMTIYKGGKVVCDNIVVCTSQQMTNDAVTTFLEDLQQSAKNQTYLAVKKFYADILGADLEKLTTSQMEAVLSKIEKKYAVSLTNIFGEAKVGKVSQMVDRCSAFLADGLEIWDILQNDGTADISGNIKNLVGMSKMLEDDTVKDPAVKNQIKVLKKAAEKLARAYSEYADGNIEKKENSFWRMYFECPVNVSVYNADGEQIGYIGEDDIWSTEELTVRRMGEAKEIYVLSDILPKVVVTAEDYGTMDCVLEEYNCGVPVGRLNYYGITLEPEQQFSTTLVNNLKANAQTLTFESGEESIYANEYISAAEDQAAVNIFCNVEGAESSAILGAGTYIRGDYAVLYARSVADCAFAGWFEGERLVSEDRSYGFSVTEDRSLMAKYVPIERKLYVSLSCSNGGFTVGERECVESEWVAVLAVPNEGYKFEGWYVNNKLVSTDEEYGFEVSEDTALYAEFAEDDSLVYSIALPQSYLAIRANTSIQLSAQTSPESFADMVQWSVEGNSAILSVSPTGTVTAHTPGTAYVLATLSVNGTTYTARCRIDVTEQAPNEEVLSIDLTSPKVTTDLYSTDYTQIDILPRLPQNEVAAFAATPEDNGAAITGAYLEDETARALFDLWVKDDRTLLVVPTQAAIEGAKGVKSSYSSKLAVSVNGVEYHTAEAVTIGVKKTLPKLKAGNLTFNPFYTGQSQALNITGGTVTKIEGTMPDWLELDGTKLTLKNAPKSGSASVNLLVYTEEWAVPVSVKVNVKLSYKAPAVKLSASSVSLSDSGSKGTTLKLSAGKKTLEELGVESIRLPEGFEETVLDLSTGEFNLVPTGAIPTGKQTVRVYFYDTDAVLDLPLTVGKKSPTLKLSKGSVNLNGDLGDSVTLKVTATSADLDLTKVVVTNPNEAVEVSPVNADGEFTVTVKAGTAPKANFPLTIQAPTGKAAKLTVKTLAVGQKVTMSLKAVGSIDLTYPEKGVDIQPVFKNYSGKLENVEYNLGDFLTLGEDDLLRWNGNIGLTTGTYPVTMTGNLPDGTVRSGTVKVKVIQTAVALKLGKTSLSLNKRLKESAQINVTSGTKGYTLGTLGIRVTDSKNVTSDGLTAAYADGLLTLAVNDRTAYGSTYKVQLWATSNKISTVTVKIPAEKASAVTMTAKAKGQIDVIRDASQVLVTPSYKNCLDGQSLGKQVKVTWAKDGKNYTQDVTGRFDLNWADGALQVSRMPGETLELTGKYRLEILCEGMEKPAYVNLAVKSGTAKVTAAPVRLYTKDTNHRAELTFMSSDRTLNAVAWVELKDAKLKASYEVLDLGDGQFALRLLPGAKAKNGTVTVNIFFEGNNGKKPNATTSVKVEIR